MTNENLVHQSCYELQNQYKKIEMFAYVNRKLYKIKIKNIIHLKIF